MGWHLCVCRNLVEGEIWFMTFISLRWHLLLMFVICLRSPVTYSIRPLQVLWFSLSHFCGPVGGARKLSVAFWGVGSLERLPQASGPHTMLQPSWCAVTLWSYGEHLLDLTSPGKPALESPIYWASSHHYSLSTSPSSGDSDKLDCFLLTLCPPSACGNSSKPSWEPPITSGILPNLWRLCWLLLSIYSLFREFPKSILKH